MLAWQRRCRCQLSMYVVLVDVDTSDSSLAWSLIDHSLTTVDLVACYLHDSPAGSADPSLPLPIPDQSCL